MSILWITLCPCIKSPIIFLLISTVIVLILHPEVARKVTVVVWTRIGSIVPVHCCVTVLTCTPKHCCRSLKIIRRLNSILKYSNRLEGLADTGVAHLAVLVTPVTVVHVVTHQVIHLLSRSILSTSLSRSSKCHETEFVYITKLFLYTSIVSEVTIVNSLYPIVSSDTC